ncbi:MAG: Fe-S cluster assembly protein SufD [Rhodocyclaceae bacterium]
MNALASGLQRHYVESFDRLKGTLPGHRLPWLAQLREQALQRFAASGFPTLRDEDWKYTSVAQIADGDFQLQAATGSAADGAGLAELVDALALPGAHLLVFVDGRYTPGLSRLGALPAGVVIGSLAVVLDGAAGYQSARLQAVLDQPRNRQSSGFAALNLACLADGAYLHLAAGAKLAEPIHLLFVACTADLATHTRNLLVAEHDSCASVVEQHVALGTPRYLTNVATEIVLGRAARVAHYKVQDESSQAFHIAAINAELLRETQLLSASFAVGGALARTGIGVGLNAKGAECVLDGLYLSEGRQHIDHHTRIDHFRPDCRSRELYKGVLGGASRAVFNGKVIVHPDAQRSDAAQTNRNLLLSANAEVDSKPQLEIWADDVKCSHGATVGQLDAEQIFYLRSRGIAEAAARALLTYAFAAEMVQRVALPALRERLDRLLRGRLPDALP